MKLGTEMSKNEWKSEWKKIKKAPSCMAHGCSDVSW
jgi:hypothetical protein